MVTRQIPPIEWPEFFTDLSERYEGWTIEVERPGKDELRALTEFTLDSVTIETGNGETTLSFAFADAIPLRVVEPSRVSVEQNEENGEEEVEVETPSETFRNPAAPSDAGTSRGRRMRDPRRTDARGPLNGGPENPASSKPMAAMSTPSRERSCVHRGARSTVCVRGRGDDGC
jgi:hypothetical protein